MKEWDDLDRVVLELWTADAVVLFDWLMSVDFETIPVTHRGQKQALMDLLTALEVTEVAASRGDDIGAAQERVARDMDW
ncbi:MAG: hypothetical protein AB1627_09420 [Chloroflexota bacterium]